MAFMSNAQKEALASVTEKNAAQVLGAAQQGVEIARKAYENCDASERRSKRAQLTSAEAFVKAVEQRIAELVTAVVVKDDEEIKPHSLVNQLVRMLLRENSVKSINCRTHSRYSCKPKFAKDMSYMDVDFSFDSGMKVMELLALWSMDMASFMNVGPKMLGRGRDIVTDFCNEYPALSDEYRAEHPDEMDGEHAYIEGKVNKMSVRIYIQRVDPQTGQVTVGRIDTGIVKETTSYAMDEVINYLRTLIIPYYNQIAIEAAPQVAIQQVTAKAVTA